MSHVRFQPGFLGVTTVAEQAVPNGMLGTASEGEPYPAPTHNHMPQQERTPGRKPVS